MYEFEHTCTIVLVQQIQFQMHTIASVVAYNSSRYAEDLFPTYILKRKYLFEVHIWYKNDSFACASI